MVDSIGKKIVALVSIFAAVYAVFSLFGPPSPEQHIRRSYFRADFNGTSPNDSEFEKNYTSQFVPKYLTELYKGDWKAREEKSVFSGMTSSEGIVYFHIGKEDSKELTEFKLYIFDGIWESNNLYKITFHKAKLDTDKKSLSSDSCVIKTDQKDPELTKCACTSLFEFSADKSNLFKIRGSLRSEECGLDLKLSLHEFTSSEKQEPVVTYSFIISCGSVFLIFCFARHTQDCVSENVAKKTSLWMLGMQATIDLFFCLYHCHMAVAYEDSFDYLMLASFWCFAVFMIIQGRLTLLVWKAQNPDLYAEGLENFRRHYSGFQTKFLLVIISSVIIAVIFDFLFYYWVIIIHSFFVPQIMLNAKHGYKYSIKTQILAIMFITRLSIVLYFFGCPANFLAISPNMEFCALIAGYLSLQLAILLMQNTKIGPRFFVPRFLRPKIYSYYRTLEEEKQIEENTDCIICMTPLNLQGKDLEGTVNRAKTMHTPCGHKFHEDCLMNWMVIKMECPTCRAVLPVLEE